MHTGLGRDGWRRQRIFFFDLNCPWKSKKAVKEFAGGVWISVMVRSWRLFMYHRLELQKTKVYWGRESLLQEEKTLRIANGERQHLLDGGGIDYKIPSVAYIHTHTLSY